jgi:predicted aconitase with swiveling domain
MGGVIRGRAVVPGAVAAEALVSEEPLSFWGGYDHRTGEIIDRRHPLSGQVASGRILVIPFTRGSSTTTAVLLEAVKQGTAPAGIVTERVDSFLALAAIVADELYGHRLPVVVAPADAWQVLRTGQRVTIAPDGAITIEA